MLMLLQTCTFISSSKCIFFYFYLFLQKQGFHVEFMSSNEELDRCKKFKKSLLSEALHEAGSDDVEYS